MSIETAMGSRHASQRGDVHRFFWHEKRGPEEAMSRAPMVPLEQVQLRDFIARQRPVPAASEHGQVLTNGSISLGVTGPLK